MANVTKDVRFRSLIHLTLEVMIPKTSPRIQVTMLNVIGRNRFQSSHLPPIWEPLNIIVVIGKEFAHGISWFQRVGQWYSHHLCEQPRYHMRILLVPLGKLWTEGPRGCVCNTSWGMARSKNILDKDMHYSKMFWFTTRHVQSPGFNPVSCLMGKIHLKLSNCSAFLWFDASNMSLGVSWSCFFQISSPSKCSQLIQQLHKQSRKRGTSQNHLWTFITFSTSTIETFIQRIFQVNSIQMWTKLLKSWKVLKMVNTCLPFQGTNIFHLGKRKIIFKIAFFGGIC